MIFHTSQDVVNPGLLADLGVLITTYSWEQSH